MTNSALSEVIGSIDQPLLDQTIGDALRSAAKRFGSHDAIVSVFQGKKLSYSELDKEADRVAAALLAKGVRAGDRIAIWSPNRIEWILAHHGAVRVGAIVVTVNPALRQDEVRYVLQDSDAAFVFASQAFRDYSFKTALEELRSDLTNLKEIVYFSSEQNSGNWSEFLDSALLGGSDLLSQEKQVFPESPCSLQYTSGTTGRPKGALLTHRNILNNGHFVGERQLLSATDRICLPVPFFHCFGLVLGALAAVTHGSAIILPADSFDPQTVLKTIQDEKCTSLYGVPMMFISLLTHPATPSTNLSSLRTGCIGGAPCPIETMRQTVSTLNMREITVCYGMTETSPISFQSLPDDSNEIRVTTVGRIHPHIEAKIIDSSTGQTVERGLSGELCIRGYSVMLGYWQNQKGTDEAIDKDGWMHSGDLATMLPNGYVKIVGRLKNTIIRGGENIYPREIEEYLLTLPQIAEAYIFGLPDEKYGEEVCAWVRLKDGAHMRPEELRELCKGKIATYKIPRHIRFVDSFPTTASGKVQYFKMRDAELALVRNNGEAKQAI